ncbi:hypothetical protein EDB83DRAFT_2513530 [Lactarius deliciosus]|nr:hypothetical protein EDB83DRAFT_2513530 [Lactarius deliciosus]
MATVALSTSKSQARNRLSVVAYPIIFLSLQFVSSFRPGTGAVPVTPLELAVVESLKLAANVLIRYRSGEGLFCKPHGRTALWDVSHEQPLQGLASQDDDGSDAVVFASVVWASAAYTFSSALFFFDAVTVHLAAAASTLFVLYGFYALMGQHIGMPVLQSTVLQLLGVSLAKVALSNPSKSTFLSLLVLLSVAFTSACNVFVVHNIYRSHAPSLLNMLNTLLFSSGLCFHVIVCIYNAVFAPTSPTALVPEWTLRRISALIIRAQLDWTTLSVIHDHDAILERVLYTLSLALLFLVISTLNASFSLAVLAGSSVALWTSISYVSEELYKSHHHLYDTSENESSAPMRRRRTIAGTIFAVLGLGSIIGANESILSRTESPILAPNVLPSPGPPTCQRRPLHFSPPLDSDSDSRKYRHFDDVLLIVFFSHARYDTNLDSYRDVYAEYFPNILFIGPANREDAGFEHSYDVSTRATTAISGRPSTALLNVPRLQLFDQNRFWYHSPFGRYVPNPALDPSAMSNASLPRTTGEHLSRPCRHAALEGLGRRLVVSEAQRDRLAALTGQRDRLIGGSADTMYIPGRHRETFMSVLALFLQTDCFLEIAAPTALHLSLPRDEDILYVDHWWIWQPPFDTEFVRGKWAEGREVDTFHAFHWGEPSEEGGVWEPRPERIEDVRRLLQDSAARQGNRFPKVTLTN